MRTNLIICIIITLALILCPVGAVGGSGKEEKSTPGDGKEMQETEAEGAYISVMSSSTGRIDKIGMREYIIGCVACEMSALYHTEALKAQAVACYTYAEKTREQNEKHKSDELKNADITDSPDTHQGYINEKKRKEKWGEKFEEYEAKIEAAVDEVFGSVITYNGETVLAVYHSISAGATQSAKELWGSEFPYLISVESQGDKLSPDYMKKTDYTEKDFKAAAEKCGVKLSGDAEKWVGTLAETDSGYVTGINLGNKNISASKFREAFDLRSLCFDVEYTDGKFIIICYGYGHGVGMSQYGADYMARQGSTWQEILLHYYPGTRIEKE